MNKKGANMKRATAKIITILLMATMATAITGCSNQNETTESSEALANPADHERHDIYASDINKNIFEYVDPEDWRALSAFYSQRRVWRNGRHNAKAGQEWAGND